MASSNHFVGSCQHSLWDREADLLGGFQIDQEFKLRRLLDRQIGWLAAFQNLVHLRSRSTEQIRTVRAVRHQTSRFCELA